MNFQSHLSFGLFTALLVFLFTGSYGAAGIMLIFQVFLIIDFLFKRLIQFEPMHTLLSMLIVWVGSMFITHLHWYVLVAYATHLALDLFVKEDIPLLWPSKHSIKWPMKHAEATVQLISWSGSALIFVVLVAQAI